MLSKLSFRLFTLLVLLKIFAFGFACKPSKSIAPELQKVDSIWQKIHLALDKDTPEYKAVIVHLYQAKSLNPTELDWLKSQLKSQEKWKEGSDLASAIFLLNAWHLMENQQDSLAFLELQKINTQQIDILLSKIQLYAFHHYINNSLDSALNYYQQMYQIAKSRNNISWLLQSTNNIGTVYFDQHYFEIAATYFTEAIGYAQEMKIEVPMLINNMVTCALVNSSAEEAISLYQKYKSSFKPNNPYEKAIYDLNRIHIYWKTNEYDSFKYHLDRLEYENLGAAVKGMRDKQYVYYFVLKKNRAAFLDFFFPYKEKILSEPNEFFATWTDLLNYAADNGFPTLSKSELINIYQYFKESNQLPMMSAAALLMAKISSNAQEKNQWEITHLNTELNIRNTNAVNFQKNLKNQIQINDLYYENQSIKNSLLIQSAERKTFAIMLIGTIIILIVSGVSFALYQKNRKITIQKLQLEIQNNRSMNELSQQKKQFAERLITSQEAINKKLEKLILKMKQISQNKDPEIVQIRKELMAITELKNEWAEELQQINSNDDIHYLFDHFDCIRQFNQTEMRLLSYFIQGHKTKEIAALSSLSEQHVRNTKTKLIKTISSEFGKNITFDDLGALRDRQVL